jgi:hypothetical protein
MYFGTEMLLCDAHILVVHTTLTLLQIYFGGLLKAILYQKKAFTDFFPLNTNDIWM